MHIFVNNFVQRYTRSSSRIVLPGWIAAAPLLFSVLWQFHIVSVHYRHLLVRSGSGCNCLSTQEKHTHIKTDHILSLILVALINWNTAAMPSLPELLHHISPTLNCILFIVSFTSSVINIFLQCRRACPTVSSSSQYVHPTLPC